MRRARAELTARAHARLRELDEAKAGAVAGEDYLEAARLKAQAEAARAEAEAELAGLQEKEAQLVKVGGGGWG